MSNTWTGYLLNIQLGSLYAYTVLNFFLVVTICNEDEATGEEFASSGSGHNFQKASDTEE